MTATGTARAYERHEPTTVSVAHWVRDWLPIIAMLAGMVYGYGELRGRFSSVEMRLDRIERLLLERGTRAEGLSK